ncbi:hypothetical protein [uncultured Psychromonas sp.]|uniref:DUF3024 domain-containing protein n=1 Tax=uncultured Psychromonas sp. TaxID=173974 RepID=UPI0026161E77|nr:hypothetical protein [uncultured Psychromonas sp.]
MKKWMAAPTKPTKVTDAIKNALNKEAEKLIDNIIKPRSIKVPQPEGSSNYLVDIYTKWYGNSFYFCSKYNSPGENAISPSFEIKFARVVYAGDEKFSLSYMRYNDKWFELHRNLTLQECLYAIKSEPYFML